MRKGTLTVKLKFKVLPDGLSGQSVAGEPVFPASIAQGNTFEVDISPICDTRKAEVKYSLVSNSLESVTDTAKIYIPASLDAYNIAFKRKLVQSIIYCATERERVWATIDYEATRLFTGIVDLSNLTIQSYSYQGDIELTLKDNGYLLDEKIAQSIELPVQAFPRFSPASSPKTKGVYYKDPDNANAFYFWNGSAWAHKESFTDTESKYFHPDATVRVWSSAVVGGELVESVVGTLLGMAGYSVSGGTIDPSASDTSTSVVRCFTYDMSEDKTYKEVLDTLLKEYRMCLTFTPEGKVRIVSLSHTSIHATRDIGYGLKGTLGRRDGIKTTFEASKKDGVKLKYSSGLAVRREQSIYSENLGSEFDEDGELKGTAIKPQQCLPETGDITATYQEYNAKFLDRAYTTKVNRKENEDLSIISTHGHHLEVAQKGGTLTYPAFTVGESAEHGTGANPYFMPKKAQVLFRNDYEMKNKDPDSTEYGEEAESHSIYLQIFNIVADVLYRDKTTTIYAPSATANPETYESTYLFEDGPARAFANFYLGWNQYGAMKTDWTEYKGTVDTIGSIIGYQHTDSAISSYCLLSEETISFTGSPDVPFVIKMHGIGIAPYNDKPVQSVSYMGDNKTSGKEGPAGNGIKEVVADYAVSWEYTEVPTEWSKDIPEARPLQYLWKRTTIKYTNPAARDTVSYTYNRQPENGKAMTYMYASAPEGLYPGGSPFGTDQNVIGMADTAIGIDYEWHDTVPDIADGYVLWTKTTAPDGTVSIYRVQGPKGEPGETGPQGPQGATGSAGKGIASITEYYLASASSTAPSASDTGWSTSAQTPTTAKPYLWNKTVVAYTTGSPTTTIAMIGQSIKGNTGAPGGTGATGTSVTGIIEEYALSTSNTSVTGSWGTAVPTLSPTDKYLWNRSKTMYSDGTSSAYTTAVVIGVYGDRGKTGEKGDPGATGATGWSQATLQLFKRSATAPSAYDGEALTYTFSTATLAGNHGSWSVTIPGGSNPLYVIYAPAFGQGETDVVEVSDWTVPAILSENGTRGENGDTVATVMLYQRSASTPAKPTGVVTYNFLSGQVSNTGSWSNSVPASDGNPLWVITAVASVTGSSNVHEDTIQPTEWSTPSIMAKDGEQGKQGIPGEQGPQGEKGDTGATGNGISKIEDKYLATATDSTPTAGWADWNTTDKAVESKPYLWNWTRVTYTNGTVHDTKTLIATWVKGADGTDGASFVAIEEQYCRTTTATAPTTGWASTITNVDKDHRYLWNRSRTVTKNSAGSTVYGGWSTAYIIAVFGEQGIQGETGPQGEKGDTGLTGATGNGIKSVTVSYGVSASPSTQPTSWSSTIPAVAENQFLWTRTITDYTSDAVADTVTYTYAKQGKSGSAGTSVTVSSIQYQAGTSATTAPTGTWSNNPVSVAQGQFLWTKTTFSDGKVAYGVARQGTDGKPGGTGATGAAAKDFTLYQSSTFFEVSPRGVTHKMQVISITCVPLNLTSPTITWSVSSAVPTQAISSDKTVLSLTVQSGVALSDMTVACAVSDIGTKSITILSTPTGENGPLYLGTDWDESATTTSEGDPLESGDYYLRLSDTMVRVYSGTEWRDVSAATSTHKMMQDALSDVLKHGADVKSTSSVLYAYIGNLVAQSASIKSLSTEVITSANYDEDSSGQPSSGYKLDGPNNLIKSYGMQGYNSQFHDISIKGGHITINDESKKPVFVTNEADQGTEINATGDAPTYYDIDEFIEGLSKNSLQDETISASKDGNTFSYDGYYINDTDGTVNVQAVPSDSSYTWTQSITMTVTKENSDGTKNAFGTASYSGKNTVNLLYIIPRNTGKLTVSIKNSAGTEICRVTRTARNGYSFSNYFSEGDVETETGLNPASASGNFTYNFTFEMTNISGLGAVGSTFGVKFECEMHAAYSNTLGAKRIGFVSRSYTNTGILYHGYYGYFPLGKKYLGTSAPITIGTRKTSDYLNYGLASSFISKLTAGTYQVNVDKTMLYQDGETSRSTMSVVAVTAASLDITSTQGDVRYTSTDYIKGTPKIRFTPVSTLKGATVLNLNASNSASQIGTVVQKFANVWASNLNNVAVTDSNNESLAVSGASSIVGALNQINRDLDNVPSITKGETPNGYLKIGNILIQWGRYTSGINKDQSISVTYPQPFSAVANPVATPYKHGNAYIYTTIISESLTGCTIRVSGSWAQGVFWIAIGY